MFNLILLYKFRNLTRYREVLPRENKMARTKLLTNIIQRNDGA